MAASFPIAINPLFLSNDPVIGGGIERRVALWNAAFHRGLCVPVFAFLTAASLLTYSKLVPSHARSNVASALLTASIIPFTVRHRPSHSPPT